MLNKNIAVLIITGIAAVLSLMYGITAVPGWKVTRAAIPSAANESELARPAGKLVFKERQAAKTKFESWKRNPFIRDKILEKPPVAEPLILTLNGIVWNARNPRVLINNSVLSKGDKIGINTIVDIKQKCVILNDGTNDFEIKLR